jgi:hypothetical protein
VRGVPFGTVSFRTDGGEVHRACLGDEQAGAVQWRTTAAETAFVRVEVRHPCGQMAALINPIVLEPDTGTQ